MKVLSNISLAILILFSSAHLFGENTDFNDLLEARKEAFLSQPQFKNLSDEKKHLLGSCWGDEDRKCMTQNCSYCSGDGSCSNCDDPTNCPACSGTCQLSGDQSQQADCADICAATTTAWAAKHCWF